MMKKSTMTAQFPCDCQTVWDIVTDNENYEWRSDLSKIEIIDENQFNEYTRNGFVTHFRITTKEPYQKYQFDMENQNMSGHWSGIFGSWDGGTQITFIEEVHVKNPIMNLFVKGYLKKQQAKYITDLRTAIEKTSLMNNTMRQTYKKLSEMSMEELWQLFPIMLTEYKPYWKDWYTEEADILKGILPAGQVIRISHIGSTAVAGIWAKPIIDILVEVTENSDFQSFKEWLVTAGYFCMSQNRYRLSFNKGYTEEGFAERVFHLHLRRFGDNDELYFRDYLNTYLDTAQKYEKLKLELWKQYEYDRDGYTKAKTEFVQELTGKAKKEFHARYEK